MKQETINIRVIVGAQFDLTIISQSIDRKLWSQAKPNIVPGRYVHFNEALNSGCIVTEDKELVLHMSVYVGFPKTICA